MLQFGNFQVSHLFLSFGSDCLVLYFLYLSLKLMALIHNLLSHFMQLLRKFVHFVTINSTFFPFLFEILFGNGSVEAL